MKVKETHKPIEQLLFYDDTFEDVVLEVSAYLRFVLRPTLEENKLVSIVRLEKGSLQRTRFVFREKRVGIGDLVEYAEG